MADQKTEFERAASEAEQGIVAEFTSFLKHNKKFWLIPLLGVMLLFAGLLFLSSTAAAPFIYTLF